MQKVIINPSKGGTSSGNISGSLIEKNFNLEISKEIYNNLKKRGIDVYLVRDDDTTLTNQERLEIINSYINSGDTVIVLTNMLASGNSSGAEIIYALRDTDNLSREISNSIEDTGIDVLKYYQLRDPNNTALDFYEIIRELENSESLIVSYGYVDNSFDNSFLLNNKSELAKAVSNAIYNYLKKENVYIVKSGDTLYQIASRFNTSVDRIKQLNNLSSNALTIGQELIIPKEETKDEEEPDLEEGYLNYTVKRGDSLYSIARNYNTTVNALIDINNLTSNNLSIGQILRIPTSNTDNNTNNNYINYTVKSGDSLYKIANTYNTTVNEIKSLNNLTSNNLSIGQVLRIPTSNTNNNTNNNYINYTVKSGDSLYKIANTYNTTVNEIKSLNNLTSNNLSIGQVLRIPTSNTNNNTNNNYINYTVKSGDSLYKIANTYNTTVNEIKSLNNLTSNNLSIGQTLKIPTNNTNNYINYTVKSGDSLYKIANTYNTTVNEIKSLNNLTSNNLSIGQVLIIPT